LRPLRVHDPQPSTIVITIPERPGLYFLSARTFQTSSRPTISLETTLAYPNPRLQSPFTCPIHDRARQTSRPFRICHRTRICGISLGSDDERLIEHPLNIRRIVRRLNGRCVRERRCPVARWTPVREVDHQRCTCIHARHVASEKRRPCREVLRDELVYGRWYGRERVGRGEQLRPVLRCLKRT
jgi:hypothetical protein